MTIRQYTGARYVPIIGRKGEDSIAWDNSKPYEALTIVSYQGNSYTSRQDVPAGVDITNGAYWAKMADHNAQYDILEERVDTLEAVTDADGMSIQDIKDGIINPESRDSWKRGAIEVENNKPQFGSTHEVIWRGSRALDNFDLTANIQLSELIGTASGSLYCTNTPESFALPFPAMAGSVFASATGASDWVSIRSLARKHRNTSTGGETEVGGSQDIATRVSFRGISNTQFTSARPTFRLNVSGTRALPPADNHLGHSPIASEIVACAKSYAVEARNRYSFGEHGQLSRFAYSYGNNWTYQKEGASPKPLTNGIGQGLMECDTLVLMAVSGVPFANSPYNNDFPKNATHSFQSGFNPPYTYLAGKHPFLNNHCAALTRQCWLYWDEGVVFDGGDNYANVESGDIVILRHGKLEKDESFDNAGHTGVVYWDNGVLRMIHCSIPTRTGGNVVDDIPLDEYRAKAKAGIEGDRFGYECYFARIMRTAPIPEG